MMPWWWKSNSNKRLVIYISRLQTVQNSHSKLIMEMWINIDHLSKTRGLQDNLHIQRLNIENCLCCLRQLIMFITKYANDFVIAHDYRCWNRFPINISNIYMFWTPSIQFDWRSFLHSEDIIQNHHYMTLTCKRIMFSSYWPNCQHIQYVFFCSEKLSRYFLPQPEYQLNIEHTLSIFYFESICSCKTFIKKANLRR